MTAPGWERLWNLLDDFEQLAHERPDGLQRGEPIDSLTNLWLTGPRTFDGAESTCTSRTQLSSAIRPSRPRCILVSGLPQASRVQDLYNVGGKYKASGTFWVVS